MSPCGPATDSAQCPALLVSAPASGQGKTLVTAALARRHRRAGRRVRVFKCGPDFLDPMILERASGAPVHQLDLFMVGEEECRRLLHEAAQDADVILVEGVMGLYDGDPSAADLAARFGLPVLAVLDGSAMAQTFGALVLGLARYRSDTRLLGVLANRVGSARHGEMLEESLPDGIAWLGALARDPDLAFPERHLGLLQADEIADLDARLDRAAASLPEAQTGCPKPSPFPPRPDAQSPRAPWRGTRSPSPAMPHSASSTPPTSPVSKRLAYGLSISRHWRTRRFPPAMRSGYREATPSSTPSAYPPTRP